jgi:hypothetical protein
MTAAEARAFIMATRVPRLGITLIWRPLGWPLDYRRRLEELGLLRKPMDLFTFLVPFYTLIGVGALILPITLNAIVPTNPTDNVFAKASIAISASLVGALASAMAVILAHPSLTPMGNTLAKLTRRIPGEPPQEFRAEPHVGTKDKQDPPKSRQNTKPSGNNA